MVTDWQRNSFWANFKRRSLITYSSQPPLPNQQDVGKNVENSQKSTAFCCWTVGLILGLTVTGRRCPNIFVIARCDIDEVGKSAV